MKCKECETWEEMYNDSEKRRLECLNELAKLATELYKWKSRQNHSPQITGQKR